MIRFALAFLVVAAAPLGAQAWSGRGADIPDGHRPPPGMCRIWLDGVPPGRQPAPTDCATAIRRRPPNARVIFGEEVRGTRDQAPHADRQPDQPVSPQTPPPPPPARDARPADKGKERKPDHPVLTPLVRHGHPGGWLQR